jgi:putative flippase GtrA
VLASVCSFCAAVLSNFIWNRYWTYPDSRSKPVVQQAFQFALVNVIGLLVRTPIFALSEGPMTRLAERFFSTMPAATSPGSEGLLALEPHVVGPNLALALAVIVVLFWNFGVNRIWTYSDVR